MPRLTDAENRELSLMMLREGTHEQRAREEAHRALPRAEQPHMIVCFGILSYEVLWVSPLPGDRGLVPAEHELEFWKGKARRGGLWVRPLTSKASEHDFQIRQQWDLDDLTRAILSSYA